jgi:ornithine cyclodeaminase
VNDVVRTLGVKWIASFPANVARGFDRASGLLVLNSAETGRPLVLMDGAPISAVRTGAMAGVAARALEADLSVVGIIGAGPINFEVLRAICVVDRPSTIVVYDSARERALQFAARAERCGLGPIRTATEVADALSATVVSIATNSVTPHIHSLAPVAPDAVVLHISLRDLDPWLIVSADNIVDDVAHVFRANTSLHLAEQLVGHRRFVRAPLSAILRGSEPPRTRQSQVRVFSPFGLAVLDVAVGRMLFDEAQTSGALESVRALFAPSWAEQ